MAVSSVAHPSRRRTSPRSARRRADRPRRAPQNFSEQQEMQVLLNVVLAVQMLSALVMIGLVLIQHGKGADMGASFGSGSSGSLFGATGSANFLSRSTAVSAA